MVAPENFFAVFFVFFFEQQQKRNPLENLLFFIEKN